MSDIYIENFKSLKFIELNGCRRINIFIGKPGSGKSNLLEGLTLFDTPYIIGFSTSPPSLKELIRIQNIAELFHYGSTSKPVKISVGDNRILIHQVANNRLLVEITSKVETEEIKAKCTFLHSLRLTTKMGRAFLPNILCYRFPETFVPQYSNMNFLQPPIWK